MKKKRSKHDPQEEEYAALAQSEGDKFDNRLFWFTGGVGALSLGYFQTTKALTTDPILIAGYASLILSIALMLFGLRVSSNLYARWSGWFRDYNERHDKDKHLREEEENLRKRTRWLNVVNIVALLFSLAGTVLVVIYMFRLSQ